MTAVAIILARAGSKGVPGKNVRDVAGRPCIAWTIEHAKRSRLVSQVMVSTDDERAAAIARDLGADVCERPAALASDTARVDDAARQALRDGFGPPIGCRSRPDGGAVVILYGNVPVRPADLTDRALGLLLESRCDSVQSYTPVGKHHPWWTARLGDDGRVAPWEGDVLNHGVFRRQDLPPAFVPDGGVIAVTRAALMLEITGVQAGPHAFFGKDRRGVVNPEGAVVDIDTETDLVVADAILRGGGGRR